jgi:hypothetical protein
MQPTIPLDKMSISEKIQALEEIWEDLSRSYEALPSPRWHADVLAAREHRARSGKSKFSDWPDAKRRIRERAR